MTFLREDESFESFVTQARALLGPDVAKNWLLEIWSGADGDLNRALNHVLDSPDEKIRRGNAASKPAKPARLVSADFEPTFPEPSQHGRLQAAQPIHAAAIQQGGQFYAPPATMPSASLYAPQPLQTGPFFLPGTANFPMTAAFHGGISAGIGAANGGAAAISLPGALETLTTLRGSLESILASPSMLQNSAIMAQLHQQLLQALEVPEAAKLLQERGQRVEAQQRRIQTMQERLTALLADPGIARNPGLLQNLGDQIQELRRITTANLQEQELFRSTLVTSSPAELLLTAGRGGAAGGRHRTRRDNESSESSSSTDAEMDEEWWEKKKLKKQRRSRRQPQPVRPHLSAPSLAAATNPFRPSVPTQPEQPGGTGVFQTRSQF
jgi:hypothetical protein